MSVPFYLSTLDGMYAALMESSHPRLVAPVLFASFPLGWRHMNPVLAVGRENAQTNLASAVGTVQPSPSPASMEITDQI